MLRLKKVCLSVEYQSLSHCPTKHHWDSESEVFGSRLF